MYILLDLSKVTGKERETNLKSYTTFLVFSQTDKLIKLFLTHISQAIMKICLKRRKVELLGLTTSANCPIVVMKEL